jgi:TolB-like protein/tetratricopeptide (TPR) repeat protein
VKILDFGLAKTGAPEGRSSEDDATVAIGDAQLTTPGTAIGTVAYMSPEQALGKEVDARTDIFSLGVVLYEMAAGRSPFAGATNAATFDGILNRAPEPLTGTPAGLPADVARIIDVALEKDRENRYQTVAELRSDLETRRSGMAKASGRTVDADGPQSIAVLPFINMSSDVENEYFTDGMAEEIILSLSKVGALRVASRTSSFAFKGKSEDVRTIGRELGVSTILEGSVRKAGSRLRISAQLVKVDDGYHLWSDRFDRDLEDVFAVQDEIAESITGALSVVLSPREKRAMQRVPTENMEAYDNYLRGRHNVHSLSDSSLRRAESFFQRAVEIDPGFALGWVGVAETAAWIHDWFTPTEDLVRTADQASQKALAIDPDLAEAHVARGLALWIQRDVEGARGEFEVAAHLDPLLFDAAWYHARVCVFAGDLEAAASFFAKAAQLRREDYQAAAMQVTVLPGLGRHDEARAAARDALARIEKHLKLHTDDARAVCLGASAWSTLGEHEKAVEWARRSLVMRPDDAGTSYNAACTFAQEGLLDEAIDLLEKNVNNGWGNYGWLRQDPDLDPLREQPRFRSLLEKLQHKN